jgi:hypothetical protein
MALIVAWQWMPERILRLWYFWKFADLHGHDIALVRFFSERQSLAAGDRQCLCMPWSVERMWQMW